MALPDTPRATPIKVSRRPAEPPRAFPSFSTPDRVDAAAAKPEPTDPWDAEDDMDDEFLYSAIQAENVALGLERQPQL